MRNDTDLQDALKLWNEGKPLRVFNIPTAPDPARVWGYVLALLNGDSPSHLTLPNVEDRTTAREIVLAIEGHGWRKTMQIHIGPLLPALEIQSETPQAPDTAQGNF
jgi:hypothetical protein